MADTTRAKEPEKELMQKGRRISSDAAGAAEDKRRQANAYLNHSWSPGKLTFPTFSGR